MLVTVAFWLTMDNLSLDLQPNSTISLFYLYLILYAYVERFDRMSDKFLGCESKHG